MDRTERPEGIAETAREVLRPIEERHERMQARRAYYAGERAARFALLEEQRRAGDQKWQNIRRPLSDDPELREATARFQESMRCRNLRLQELRRSL